MQFRKDIVENKGNKSFIKLKDKESVVGIFRGEMHEFFSVWENNRTRVVEEGTPGAGFRFRVNFFVKEGTTFTPKIFEGGVTVYNQLAELHEEYNLEETAIKITRNGTGTDTTYTIIPMKQAPSKETLKFLAAAELLPLESTKQNGSAAPQLDQDDEIPF